MKRPLLVWLAFVACAIVGCGVLAWFTREMLRLDHESAEARRLGAFEENIRLALWRMDSALASVHGLEAARPAQDYEPFFRADAAYSASLAPLSTGAVLLPSPLLGYSPPFVRLHFQIEPDAAIRSPQAPPINLRPAALNAGASAERMESAEMALSDLRRRIANIDFATALPPVPSAPFQPQAPDTKEQRSVKFDWSPMRKERGDTSADVSAPAPDALATPPPQMAAPRDEAVVQQLKSAAEQVERENTLDLSARYNAETNAKRSRGLAQTSLAENETGLRGYRISEVDAARQGGASANAELADAATREAIQAPASATATTSISSSVPPSGAIVAAQQAGEDVAKTEPATPATQQPAAEMTMARSTEGLLQAVWAGDELILARRAIVDGRAVVQGAWLDWPELQAWLLSRVSDLLPEARLVPALPGIPAPALDAARRLAFLPVQLVPGGMTVGRTSLASPLRLSIGLAWAGAVIGLGALALLLRGTLRLSERRGAFVSAVTHELRTPLTTFRMYTEMLASGMVTDETKRRGYVDTLHKESERLSHLVENVLSYARLERGHAAARVEDTTPGALLARIEERLRQRAQQGGLNVRIAFADNTAELAIRTDTTAVEQVLFNLVDNATKYGRPKSGGGEITLGTARLANGRLAICVADQGPGLTTVARKRLFQPFSKSATEAAHSQPGVGLGLALCRRLARDELHGDLVLERTGGDGTVFRLELPLA